MFEAWFGSEETTPTGIPVLDGLLEGPQNWSEGEAGLFLALLGLVIGLVPAARRFIVSGVSPIFNRLRRRWPEIEPQGLATDRKVLGRKTDVKQLRQTLTKSHAAAITPGTLGGVVVKGRGGMGKTTLARHFIQIHRTDYFGIWWLRAQDRSTVIEDLAKLARRVQVAEAGADAEANAEQAIIYLQGRSEPWLLVYDNA